MQNEIEKLLDSVAFKIGTLNEAKRMFANKLAPEFNIFDYMRGDEMGLSRCIASLLNPKGTHGQGNLFLKEFLKLIDEVQSDNESTKHWVDTVTDGCQVDLEKQANGKRRIDVYLRFNDGEIIGIENKPWACDQEDQLKEYADYIKNQIKPSKWLLIYLSNFNPANSEYSISTPQRKELEKSGNFIWLNYAELVEWLKFCAQNSKALNVRIFIEELAKFVSTKINGDLDMSEITEVKSIILKSAENLKSAFHVSKVIRNVKEDLIEMFHNDLKKKLEDKNFILVWDESMSKGWKSGSSFGVKFDSNQNLYLRFEFEYSGLHNLFWGIKRENEQVEFDGVTLNDIHVLMNEFGSARKSNWWAWWNFIDDHQEFISDYRYWDTNEAPWVCMMPETNENEKLATKITNLAIRANDVFKNHINLLSAGVKNSS